MINLLPPDMKSQISAARTNRLLLRYNVLLLVALGFLLASIVVVYVYLAAAKASAEATVAENQSRASDYAATETAANNFKQNLATAKTILDNNVAYSAIILEIAHALPNGVILDNLSLDAATFGTPMVLTAKARSSDAALSALSALQSSKLLSNVSVQRMEGTGTGEYSVNVSYVVTIKKETTQ